MKFENHIPIYLQIIDIIKKQIVNNTLKSNDKLLSVRELALQLKVNPNTVQKAYQEMERTKLIFKKRGIGTFVTKDADIKVKITDEMSIKYVKNFIKKMKEIEINKKEILKKIENFLEEGKNESNRN